MHLHGYKYLMGCASVSMTDGGRYAAGVYRRLSENHLSPIEYRVFPRGESPLEGQEGDTDVLLPPLIKGYVRLGSYICGAPAWDPDFNTADLLMLLPLERIEPRYARHFLRSPVS
jgi:putative hemolysin